VKAIANDPSSEEEQGRSLAKAAADAGIECFLWSTLPSSYEISGGRFQTRLYEGKLNTIGTVGRHSELYCPNLICTGKHAVDAIIRDLGVPGAFILTGNFYENMILRNYVSYDENADVIYMKRPVINIDTDRTLSRALSKIVELKQS
jgi:hypothetical protein